MTNKRIGFIGIAILISLLAFPAVSPAQKLPSGVSAELPVAMTCPGQAPEGQMVKLIFGRMKAPIKYDPFLEPKDLAGHKTLIIILGGSGKGLGSAGVDLRDEMKRAEALIAEATRLKIKLVGIHSGGEDRRGAVSTSLIDLVAPKMQYIIVREDGNKDGLFTKLAAQHKIPLTVIQQTQDLTDIFKELFKL
ncbi:MAG: hypothetical protein H6Q84_677 [Deltaproteobacteria bacterium]|nr:hypothetical protein [Deltaproteobacteria bacterium]